MISKSKILYPLSKMSIRQHSALILAFLCASCGEASTDKNHSKCLTMRDLDKGFVVTVPANNRDITRYYRRLKGPYIAKNDINSPFQNRVNIQYAGLFSYKFWRNGKLTQQEFPQNDLSELLKFETGTSHKVETIRTSPLNPDQEWVEDYIISIENAEDYALSGCSYATVKLVYSGTETGTKLYIPELMLDVSPSQWGNYETIRKRRKLDGQKWPFNDSAFDALDYPDVIPKE